MTNDRLPAVELTTAHVRRALGGDLDSLHWLVERFSPLLYAVAAHRLGPRMRTIYDPADVVQDVWITVLPKLDALDLTGPRTTPTVLKYLTTAVVNRIHNLLAEHLRQRVTEGLPEPAARELEDPASGILSKAARSENAHRVHRALDEMRDGDREILILRGIEQQPLSAVADQLGVAAGTVAVRFHRALQKLRKLLPDSVFEDLEYGDG